MAGDLLEESVRGLPRGMARFPTYRPIASGRYFHLGTSRAIGGLEFFAD
jgi:hypothetical protein